MANSMHIDEWGALLAAAQRFRDAAPWRWLGDWPLLGLQDPLTGQVGFGSVIGAGGQAFGLIVFRGVEGLWSNVHMSEVDELGTFWHDAVLQQMDALSFSLGDRDEVSPALRKIYRQLGYSFRGRNNWPVFSSFVPGFAVAEPSGDEIGLLTRYLNRAALFAKLLQSNDELFEDFATGSGFDEDDEDGMYRVLCLSSAADVPGAMAHGDGGGDGDPCDSTALRGDDEDDRAAPEDQLVLAWIKAQPLRPLPVHQVFDEMEAVRLRRRLPKREAAWEFEVCPTPLRIGEARRRAKAVQISLCAEEGSGIILGFEMIAGPEPLRPADNLLAFIKQAGYIPDEVGVTRPDVVYGLEPLAESLGIDLVLYHRLPDLEEAFHSLMEHLSSRP